MVLTLLQLPRATQDSWQACVKACGDRSPWQKGGGEGRGGTVFLSSPPGHTGQIRGQTFNPDDKILLERNKQTGGVCVELYFSWLLCVKIIILVTLARTEKSICSKVEPSKKTFILPSATLHHWLYIEMDESPVVLGMQFGSSVWFCSTISPAWLLLAQLIQEWT